MDIQITNSAIAYFQDLLSVTPKGTNIKIVVTQPGTMNANVQVFYCYKNEETAADLVIPLGSYKLFIDHGSVAALKEATIDYAPDNIENEQLIIKAPNLKKKNLNPHSSLEENIHLLLETEVNPMLEQHNGKVNIVKLENNIVYVQFSGGCHGCIQSTFTLQNIVENIIKSNFPEITDVVDLTQHDEGTNPYYI